MLICIVILTGGRYDSTKSFVTYLETLKDLNKILGPLYTTLKFMFSVG